MRSIAPVFLLCHHRRNTRQSRTCAADTSSDEPTEQKKATAQRNAVTLFCGEKKRHETKKTVVSGGMNHPLTASRRQDLSISNNQNITFYVYSLPNSDLVPLLKM